MSARILFLLPSSQGHYNPSLRLAALLRNESYTIIYAGSNKYRELVETNGYEFYQLSFTEWLNIDHFSYRLREQWRIFVKSIFDLQTNERFKIFKAEISELSLLLDNMKPNYVFLDVFFDVQALYLTTKFSNIYLLQTMLSTRKTEFIPPLNSDFLPGSKQGDHIYVRWIWFKTIFRKRANDLLKKAINIRQDKFSLLQRFLDDGKQTRNLDKRRPFHFGISGIPEIVLSPLCMDYPWRGRLPGEYFIGFEAPKAIISYDKAVTDRLEEIYNEVGKEQRSLIYLSFGTLAGIHNKNYLLHLDRILQALQEFSNIEVIVSLGKDLKKINKKQLKERIHFFEKVPQIQVLQQAKLFLTHGGLNSILESVYTATPMLVFPLNKRWDQGGNSARVLYHNVGLRSHLEKCTVEEIKEKVSHLLSQPSYYENIETLRAEMLTEKNDLRALLDKLSYSTMKNVAP